MADGKKSFREWLRFFLGTYKPPEAIGAAYRYFKDGRFKAAWLEYKKRNITIIAVTAALAAAAIGVPYLLSLIPKPIVIEYNVIPPENALGERPAAPLIVRFHGSAAPIESADKEAQESIEISPAIEGTWRWESDDILLFETAAMWQPGQKYTVKFGKNAFPSYIHVNNTFSFSLAGFELALMDKEFYIDPTDALIKRVNFTVSANYPIDAATLEKNILIEPDIRADSGSLKKKPYQFTVTYNDTGTKAYVVSEPLGMPADSTVMRISLKHGVKDSTGRMTFDKGLADTVMIPAMTNYAQVLDISQVLVKNDAQVYDQVLVINTRGAIDEAELSKNLSLYILPKDKPALPGIKEQKDYYWDRTEEMVPEVLNKAKKITGTAIPTENGYNSLNSYKISAAPRQYLYAKINKGTKFYGGYVLAEPYETILMIKDYPKEVTILSEGSILSYSGEKRLAMMSRGVSRVKFTIGRVRPDDVNHLVSQAYGGAGFEAGFNYNFNEYNISEVYEEKRTLAVATGRDLDYFYFDFAKYLDWIPSKNLRYGVFVFTVEEDSDDWDRIQEKRVILITDLGFFVKTNIDGSRDIFVQSVASGLPVSEALVSVLGLNGNPLFSGYTGAGGRITIPNLDKFKNDKAPTVFTVSRGEDLSYMGYRSSGRGLDYSSFDVGGLRGADDQNKLQAFIFSDRGVYRPGDEVRVAMAVKAGNWNTRLSGTPLECSVEDSRDTEIFNRRFKLSASGLEEFRFSTQTWSPTGTYKFSVYLIQQTGSEERRVFLGSQSFMVEEFLPDTLNVKAAFDPQPATGWVSPGSLKALVTVQNLFGTAAAGNKVQGSINLYPSRPQFSGYSGYNFQDPYMGKDVYQEDLSSVNTSEGGEAVFNINLLKFKKASFKVNFKASAFERGSGRSVNAEASVYVSPLPWIIGYKSDGSLDYIQRNARRTVSFIALNPAAQKTEVREITANLSESRYVSVLVMQPNGTYKYQSMQKVYPVSSKTLTIPQAGLDYALPTDKPGEYILTLVGPDELEFNKINFTVAGSENLQRSLNRTAELDITLRSADVQPGGNLELMIKAPYAGSGLITIERDKVYAYKWFRTNGETAIETINIPGGMEGNGYVNVQFIRSHSSREIYMSPLCYGVVPFSISKESRTNRITLDFPREAKPGQAFNIKYSTSKPGKIIIYAVDEGILQLTRYATPDPISYFFRRRAMEVRTSQILDLVLPEYSIVRSMGAMGGGAGWEDMEELSSNINPFKRKQNAPVAYWSGILDADSRTRTVTYTVPDYFNGTLRVMAVAVSDQALGSTMNNAIVRSTFVLSPNAPLAAAPGDEFDVSLTVTNNQKGGNGKVHLSVKPSTHLSLAQTEYDLTIPEGKDQTLMLPVKAAGPVGGAELQFTASNGGESSSLGAFLSVRPAVPYRVSLSSGVIKKKTLDIAIDRAVYDDFATREAALSYLPVGIAKGLFFYLETFPYGCTEQLVSAAFPFLYPELFRELAFTRSDAEAAVNRVIGIIQARLRTDGGLGLWTAQSNEDPIVTVYGAHFLTEARNAGYYVPEQAMKRLTDALYRLAGARGGTDYDLAYRAYAIYVLTLNEIVQAPLIESLRRDMSAKNSSTEAELPGVYLAGAYALLKRTADANALLAKVKRNMNRQTPYSNYFDELLYSGAYLTILSKHFPQRLRDISDDLLLDMASRLENQEYSTMSANYALMGINAFLKAAPNAEAGKFTIQELRSSGDPVNLSTTGKNLFTTAFSSQAKTLRIDNKDALNLFYQITTAGFDLSLPKTETKNGIEVFREFLDEAGEPAKAVKTGDLVTVRLNVRTTNSGYVTNVAVVDMLPAGLESVIDSVRTGHAGNLYSTWKPGYVDIREDRVVFYGTLGPRVETYVYQARAINSGSFTSPPLFAEAMYDKTLWAMRPQDALQIGKRQ